MSIHSVILDPARAPDRTHLDLSSDPGTIANYELYPVGGQKIIVHSVPATNGFTTPAQDLVETSGNRLTLVIARTMMLDVVSQAILRGGRLSYSVPTTDAICGREFAFPLESVGRGAWLYIGTPNGSPATGSVHLVNQAGPVIGTIGVDGLGVQVLPLSLANGQPSRIWVSVQSVSAVLCQLMVQRAQGLEAMIVPPVALV